MSETVTIDTEINAPIERVWEALTDSATLSKWMMFKENTFKPEAGHKFTFSGAQGFDQTIDCEVLELDKPNKLAYSWETAGSDGQPHKTIVTWTLSEANGATQVHLEQAGFRADAKQEIGGAQYGWNHMLEQLQAVLAS